MNLSIKYVWNIMEAMFQCLSYGTIPNCHSLSITALPHYCTTITRLLLSQCTSDCIRASSRSSSKDCCIAELLARIFKPLAMLVMISMLSSSFLQYPGPKAYMGMVRVSRMIWVLRILSILLTYLSLRFFVGHIVRKKFCDLGILDVDPFAQLIFVLLLNWAWPKCKLLTCCAMTAGDVRYQRDDVETLRHNCRNPTNIHL